MASGLVWRIAGLSVLLAACTQEVPACLPAPQAPGAAAQAVVVTTTPTTIAEHSVWITPEIRADARVQEELQSAEVTFVSGNQVMLVIDLSQGANHAIADRGAAVGTARIDPGLRLDFQIATAVQSGAVYLDGTFASSNFPNVHFQGALVTWNAPTTSATPAGQVHAPGLEKHP